MTKRIESLYKEMMNEIKKHYIICGDYEWTVTESWKNEKYAKDFIQIIERVTRDQKILNTDYKLDIINKEQYEQQLAIYEQVIKICNTRIEILKILIN